jgi:hypothetical protein
MSSTLVNDELQNTGELHPGESVSVGRLETRERGVAAVL